MSVVKELLLAMSRPAPRALDDAVINTSLMTAELSSSTPLPGDIYPTYPTFHSFISFSHHILIPVMIVTGIVGNTLTFLVFVFSPLKRLSTSVFLAALAFADSCFLFSLGAGWIDNFRFSFFQQEVVCTCIVYATYIFSFLSVWFVVCFTTEMYLTLFHEDLAARISQPYKARIVVCGLTFLCGILYLHTFWTTKQVETADGKATCAFVADQRTRMALALTDSFLTLVLPFSLLIFMNTRIFLVIVGFSKRKTHAPDPLSPEAEGTAPRSASNVVTPLADDRQSRGDNAGGAKERGSGEVDGTEGRGARNDKERVEHLRHEIVPVVDDDSGDEDEACPRPRSAHGKISTMQRKSFKMLLTVAVVFLLLNLPSHVIRLQGLLRSFVTPNYVTSEVEHLCQQLFQVFYYFNFSVNFVIYNVCAKSFRTAFFTLPLIFSKLCRCRRSHKPSGHSHLPRRIGQELRRMREEQNSRLVEVNLAELRISKMESFASDFKYHSPPCLLRVSDSDHRSRAGHEPDESKQQRP